MFQKKKINVYENSALNYDSEVKSLSRVRLFMTLWTVACQVPLYMGFSRVHVRISMEFSNLLSSEEPELIYQDSKWETIKFWVSQVQKDNILKNTEIERQMLQTYW